MVFHKLVLKDEGRCYYGKCEDFGAELSFSHNWPKRPGIIIPKVLYVQFKNKKAERGH